MCCFKRKAQEEDEDEGDGEEVDVEDDDEEDGCVIEDEVVWVTNVWAEDDVGININF